MLVKKPLLNQLKVLRQRNTYWLNSVMSNAFQAPWKFEWATHMESGYQAISARDLSRLAHQYLKPAHSAWIVILPL
jgi:zinc protease